MFFWSVCFEWVLSDTDPLIASEALQAIIDLFFMLAYMYQYKPTAHVQLKVISVARVLSPFLPWLHWFALSWTAPAAKLTHHWHSRSTRQIYTQKKSMLQTHQYTPGILIFVSFVPAVSITAASHFLERTSVSVVIKDQTFTLIKNNL